ncbi:bifunctional 4-hydroxy-2-oxoglutarate aldolase/2-dehydro-3-deoxy-phosphogluconate aldolase [Temperatibacter marinus]|uniref:2-dehydro-3-deoxy-phosphogluconate aldolase n=1 Tax=Temperatibacter marinus TaxID=1456591 RepID=A0AA52EE80_9PROT|nr:bifunctional 4-hydroxy-2-oxoglutarate aldolase/2-dehydro-3-deoxy-phosphogluconate aldolase [Temperatibacter marinus]WND03166.1 bifunctional 4-hydroxy-2-oxoglutarate aldolase/2-dehydro-3-deoxy-phosphogluconate aldolase [Temperatibacter marinus]
MTFTVDDIFNAGTVIPVLAYQSIEEALVTSDTLYQAGIRVFEITLRHETALEGINAVAKALPKDAMIGAGTIMNATDLNKARDAGAGFGISPGLTRDLAIAIQNTGLPFLPGTATLSEAMMASDLGFKALKFFPASVSGGAPYLKAAGAVLPSIQFCPTGGINMQNKEDYLALSNVPVVGGSWIVVRGADGAIDQEQTYKNAVAVAKNKS